MVILLGVDDTRVGRSFRAVRIRRRLRQQDVAESAGMSRSQVSLIERGHLDAMSLRALRQAARVLEITLDVNARWRGGELDRLVNGAHSLLAEDVAAYVATLPGWVVLPEVSYSIYGERGIVDLVAWHDATRTLLIIELKTLVVDVNELTGKVDAKRRLGAAIVASRGWQPARVGVWVVVAQDRTNERRVHAHHSLLRAAFPHNGHAVRHWLASPHGELSALSMWRARDESGAGTSAAAAGTHCAARWCGSGSVVNLRDATPRQPLVSVARGDTVLKRSRQPLVAASADGRRSRAFPTNAERGAV